MVTGFEEVMRGYRTTTSLPIPRDVSFHSLSYMLLLNVALLWPLLGTSGNWRPYKSNVVSLNAALDVFCMTSPFSYLLPTVKSSREAIKIIFVGGKKASLQD